MLGPYCNVYQKVILNLTFYMLTVPYFAFHMLMMFQVAVEHIFLNEFGLLDL